MCSKGTAGGGYASVFYLADASGNSRGLLNSSQTATDGYNWDAFGNLVSRFGSNPTGFAWNVSSGYQSDADDGLTLLGHRYYDKRIGRFITQDPAGDGDNWYAYAGNDPINGTDPTGLSNGLLGSLGAPDSYYGMFEGGPDNMSIGAQDDGWITQGVELVTLQHTRTGTVTSTVDADGHITHDTVWGPWGDWSVISRTPLGGGMFAGNSAAEFWSEFWKNVLHEADTAGRFQNGPAAPGEGGNPYKGKTPDEIDRALRAKGTSPEVQNRSAEKVAMSILERDVPYRPPRQTVMANHLM